MGLVRLEDTRKAELEEFRRILLSCAAAHRRKDDGDDSIGEFGSASPARNGDVLDRMVCVTSGVSYVGTAIVNQLLVNGYSVRIIVDNEEDVEKLREMEISGEMRLNNSIIEVVMAKLGGEIESLIEAFEGCRCVFHTSAFVDPSGLSGYTKVIADVEVKATKNVIKACGASPSVRHCVLTSSLLTCIWKDHNLDQDSRIVDHKSWSDEAVCTDKKLWYALGKLRAEKAAWEIARENGLKLATICPGLIIGPKYYQRNPTSTIAYLKGVREMFAYGLLAIVDVEKLAKAHVRVFEEMMMMMKNKTACGRYICFDQVIDREDEVEKLALETRLNASLIIGDGASNSSSNRPRFELSNSRLVNLMLSTRRCCND